MTLDHLVLALWVDIHPAQLALESLPGVALHDLGAHVAAGDVLVGVLCKLVIGLQQRRGTSSHGRALTNSSWASIRSLSAFNILECIHPFALDFTRYFDAEIEPITFS